MDLALWDIKGKALKLRSIDSGGSVRNYVECYATAMFVRPGNPRRKVAGVVGAGEAGGNPPATRSTTIRRSAEATMAAGYRAYRNGCLCGRPHSR